MTYDDINKWLDGSTDWSAIGNWSKGSAPAASEDLQFLTGTQSITTSLPTIGNGINYDSLMVRPAFRGQIGSAANKLYLGTIDEILYQGVGCRECWLAVDAGDAVTLMRVQGTYPTGNSLQLFTGTFTELVVEQAARMVIGAAATATLLRTVDTNSAVNIIAESGATLTTTWWGGGTMQCSAAAGTVYLLAGTWNHLGDSTYNITALHVAKGATFNFWSRGGTIGEIRNAGTINCNGGVGDTRTITNLYNYETGVVDCRRLGATVVITNTYDRGGSVLR